MASPLLFLRDIHLSFGGKPLLQGADLALMPGDRMCLVGRNASGKSTLLRIAAGSVEADSGERFIQPGTTVRYLAQEPDLSRYATTGDAVEAGLAPADDRHRARLLLEDLGLSGDENPARLSGGEARRCALACALAPDPDILLLDEPTNHLDLPAIEWLEAALGRLSAAVILISHDRRFLSALSRTTVWLNDGATRRLDDGFAAYEDWRDGILEQDQRDRHKRARRIAAETDWLRHGVTARRKRNQGRLRALQALRRQERAATQPAGAARLVAPAGQSDSKLVIEAENVSKRYAGRPIVSGFSVRILRGQRLGIIGPNGAGKTTVLNLLSGMLEPDAGSVRHGAGIRLVSLDQRRETLDPAASVADTLTGGSGDMVMFGGRVRHVVGILTDFLFLPEQARTPVAALSGGERSRLMLAKALAQPADLLILDEPTNDLDLETLDVLEEVLSTFAGAVLLVSHDRDFLDRTVSAILVGNGDGRWIRYAGGYSDMIAQRGYGIVARPAEITSPAGPPRARPAEPRTPGSAPPARRKLSFRQTYALKTLPAKIEARQSEVAGLRQTLSDPELYARDRTAFDQTAMALSVAETALAEAEDEWLRLELLREDIEGPDGG